MQNGASWCLLVKDTHRHTFNLTAYSLKSAGQQKYLTPHSDHDNDQSVVSLELCVRACIYVHVCVYVCVCGRGVYEVGQLQ